MAMDFVVKAIYIMVKEEAGGKQDLNQTSGSDFQRPTCRDLLLPARPHLLKVPRPPTAPG